MPNRTCIVCRKKDEKKNLLRIVKGEKNEAILDEKQKINKRAIYFCDDKKCIERFFKLAEKNKISLKNEIDMESIKTMLEKRVEK